MAFNLGESFDLLTRGIRLLRERCIAGLRIDHSTLDGLLAPRRVTTPQRIDLRLRRRIQATPAYRAMRAALTE